MSDLIDRQAVINTEGLDEQIRCEMCRNPMRTDRGCDGNCKYDERLYERIMQILGERINPLSSVQPEPCSDAISRQAAIRWVKTECNPYGKPTLDFESGKRVMEHLKIMPSVQLERKWIPVTERLPEKPNMYTVTDSKGDVVRFIYTATKSSREYWKRCAKAWMPLPEPYREEGGNK